MLYLVRFFRWAGGRVSWWCRPAGTWCLKVPDMCFMLFEVLVIVVQSLLRSLLDGIQTMKIGHGSLSPLSLLCCLCLCLCWCWCYYYFALAAAYAGAASVGAGGLCARLRGFVRSAAGSPEEEAGVLRVGKRRRRGGSCGPWHRAEVTAYLNENRKCSAPLVLPSLFHVFSFPLIRFSWSVPFLFHCFSSHVFVPSRSRISSCVWLRSVFVFRFFFLFYRQPNQSTSVDVHYADSVRAKAALDAMMDGLAHGTPGLWVRSVPVKEKESINRKAVNDYQGEVRR